MRGIRSHVYVIKIIVSVLTGWIHSMRDWSLPFFTKSSWAGRARWHQVGGSPHPDGERAIDRRGRRVPRSVIAHPLSTNSKPGWPPGRLVGEGLATRIAHVDDV